MGFQAERRERLIGQILEWNSSRLDLFELSIPDEVKTEIWEAFLEIRLTNDEYPLLVQLSWSKLDREGKFVLKLEPNSGCVQTSTSENQNVSKLLADTNCTGSAINGKTRLFRRGWSFRREKLNSSVAVKTNSRRGPIGCAASVGLSKTSRSNFLPENCLPGIAKHHGNCDNSSNNRTLSNPDAPPDSSFTRTISDPEAAMQRKRQRTLEAKLIQILRHNSPETGVLLFSPRNASEFFYKLILYVV
ncbi:unnamed protein product [Trichobilharzia regenti]|nr:unnamed protein product [Trichobilharzia regenti]